MKDVNKDKLSLKEVGARESRVLDHFLTSKPEKHKPLQKKKAVSKSGKAPRGK